MKESEIQKAIIEYLEYSGAYVVRVNSGATIKKYTTKDGTEKFHRISGAKEGTPDLICCYRGYFFGLEIKKDQKEVQKWFSNAEAFKSDKKTGSAQRRAFMQYQSMLEIKDAGGECFIISSIDEAEQILQSF